MTLRSPKYKRKNSKSWDNLWGIYGMEHSLEKKFTCSPFRLVAFIDTTEKNGMPTTTITLGGNVIVVDVSYQDIF